MASFPPRGNSNQHSGISATLYGEARIKNFSDRDVSVKLWVEVAEEIEFEGEENI